MDHFIITFTSQPDSKGSTRGEGWPYSPHPSVLHPSSRPTKEGGWNPAAPKRAPTSSGRLRHSLVVWTRLGMESLLL